MALKLVKAALAALLLIAIAASLALARFGYTFRLVRLNDDIGALSPNGEFYLVETTDPTERYMLFSVIQTGDQNPDGSARTLFTTQDLWMISRFLKDAYWIEGTSDFVIDSSDTGVHTYRYDGETWIHGHVDANDGVWRPVNGLEFIQN